MNAYSEKLRKKNVEALGRVATKAEAALSFGVSRSSIKRHAKLVERRPPAPEKRMDLEPKLDRAAERLLERRLEERPTALPRRPAPRPERR